MRNAGNCTKALSVRRNSCQIVVIQPDPKKLCLLNQGDVKNQLSLQSTSTTFNTTKWQHNQRLKQHLKVTRYW